MAPRLAVEVAIGRLTPLSRSRSGIRAGVVLICFLVACDVAAAITVNYRLQEKSSQSLLFKDALAAFARSSSVRIRGSTSIDGSPVQLNVVAGVDAGGGAVTIGPATCGVILRGSYLYIKAPPLTWQELGGAALPSAQSEGWVRTSPAVRPFSTFAQFADISSFASLLRAVPRLVRGPPTSLDGATVIPLRAANRSGVTVYVTDTADPSLVAEAGPTGLLTFDEYGTARGPLVPKIAVPLNLR